MNIRLIEHRQYRSKIESECIVKILNNDGHYSNKNNWKFFNLDSKYKYMNNVCFKKNTEYIVVDHFYFDKNLTISILILMENRNNKEYMLIQNRSIYIKLIQGKFPPINNYGHLY